uniref:Uncharacterized protein n=1 Tax=Stomoxys calcitrans TaxID=35570 RepID=A0A1I8Q304_STOCA
MHNFHTNLIPVVILLLLGSGINAHTLHHNHHQQHHHPNHQNRSNLSKDDGMLEYSDYQRATPRPMEESATHNSLAQLIDDNELTSKQQNEDLLLPLSYMSSSGSTTMSRQQQNQHPHHQHNKAHLSRNHHHHHHPHQTNGQHLILTSAASLAAPTLPSAPSGSTSSFSNFIVGQHHTHHREREPPSESTRLVPTPLAPLPSYFLAATTQKYHNDSNDDGGGGGGGGGHQRPPHYAESKATKATSPAEYSKFSSSQAAAMERDNQQQQKHQQQHQQRHLQPAASRHHKYWRSSKRSQYDDDYDLQLPPKADDDYYEDYEEDTADDDDDDDEDGLDDDIDGFIDDTDNNLSDRSYARITRSKLDDDYADDEPYRNAVDDQMQRDAPPGVLTEQKFLEVGNEKAVQQARERYIQEQKKTTMTGNHLNDAAQLPCATRNSSKYKYGQQHSTPYASITTADLTPILPASYDFNYRKEIEALPMQNHTECHCVNRASLQYESMPRGKRSGSWQHHRTPQIQKPSKTLLQYQYQPQQHLVARSDMKSQTHHLETQYPHRHHHHQHQRTENMLSCHCPRHFSALEEDVERHAHLPRPHTVLTRKCRCDCVANNQTCLRFKQGEEGFSLEDRKCISEHDCKPPVCAFGDYNVQSGRCPSYRSHGKPKF